MSRRALSSILVSLAFVAGVASADPGQDRRPSRAPRPAVPHESRSDQHSLAEAVRRVERQTGGQILSAERVPFEGRDMNRIKVLDATGRVRVITEASPQPRPPEGE